mmetsp:Transcript_16524/g.18622  ORF Transcript_16524/g.18622 Transcript_16524/m.18622 type:complete len:297 (-) Transcript_16524:147-1037(-)
MSNPDLSFSEKFLVKCLKQGELPDHVAFIMDGNRRYARKKRIDKLQGHDEGLQKLKQILNWCLELNISHATVFAFAIANFQRSPDEVDHLMELAKGKFASMARDKEFFQEKGVRVNLIGEFEMLREDVRESLSELKYSTRDNTSITLNVCLAYSSTREIAQTSKEIQQRLKAGEIDISQINEQVFERMMYIPDCPCIDIMVRTSGETRLSNFMLWQAGYSYIAFLDKLWPELSLWDLAKVLLKYMSSRNQYQSPHLLNRKNKVSENSKSIIADFHANRNHTLEVSFEKKVQQEQKR